MRNEESEIILLPFNYFRGGSNVKHKLNFYFQEHKIHQVYLYIFLKNNNIQFM